MNKFIKTLEELKKLADDWKEYSHSRYGWFTTTYEEGDMKVRCYFAVKSDHTDVKFGEIGGGMSVAYHNPVQFSDFTLQSIKTLETDILKYRKWLDRLIKEHKEKTEKEIEKEKQVQIKRLKERLKELKK